MAGGRGRRGQPPSLLSWSYLKTVGGGGGWLCRPTELDNCCSLGLQRLGPSGEAPGRCSSKHGYALAGCATLSRGLNFSLCTWPSSKELSGSIEPCALGDSQKQFSAGTGLGLRDREAGDGERLGAPQPLGAAGSPAGWQRVGERGSLAVHRSSWGLRVHR